jgi:hypothetical protein
LLALPRASVIPRGIASKLTIYIDGEQVKKNLVSGFATAFCLLILSIGCNPPNKLPPETTKELAPEIVKSEPAENKFKLNKTQDANKFETIYNDGRVSTVRNSKYYDLLVASSKPLKDAKSGLTTIVTEWNQYDANVATPEGSFIQKPLLLEDPQKKEMEKAGVDANSTMVGGDEETNRRIKEPSKRYWEAASRVFEQEFDKLQKADGISNRDTNYVTFDFITIGGFYTVQEEKSKLESGESIWSNVFKESRFLNTEMARVQNESATDDQKRFEQRQLRKKQKKQTKE